MKGKINTYTCKDGHKTVTIDKDEGVTPFMISCEECKALDKLNSTATSSMYRCSQELTPAFEWYRSNMAEIVIMAKEMERDFKVNYDGAFESLLSHHNQGGLYLRKIKTKDNG